MSENIQTFDEYYQTVLNSTLDNKTNIKCFGKTIKNGNCPNYACLNGYCKKHHKVVERLKWYRDAIEKGYKICSEFTHSKCTGFVPNKSANKLCPKCLELNKKKNQTRAKNKLKKIENHPDKDINGEKHRYCGNCSKYIPLTNFISIKDKYNKYCNVCNTKALKINNNNVGRVCPLFSHFNDYIHSVNRNSNKKWLLMDDPDQDIGDYNNNSKAFFLMRSNCFYCDKLPSNNDFTGIDRLNSDGDYEEGNVVPACKSCNMMKGLLDYTDFINIIKHLCAYNKLLPNEECANFINYTYFEFKNKTCSYNDRKNEAINRGLTFNLTEDEFNTIIKNKCYYCGITPYNNEGGLDRIDIDNHNDYHKDNVVSCCSICNNLIKDLGNFKILEKARIIYQNVKTKNPEDVFENYYTLKDIHTNYLNNLPIFNGKFGKNQNDLPFFKKIYIGDISKIKSIKMMKDNTNQGFMGQLYRFINYTYYGILTTPIEFSTSYNKIYIMDEESDRMLGVFLTTTENNVLIIKKILLVGTMFTNQCFNLFLQLITSSDFKSICEYDGKKILIEIPSFIKFNFDKLTAVSENTPIQLEKGLINQCRLFNQIVNPVESVIDVYRKLNVDTKILYDSSLIIYKFECLIGLKGNAIFSNWKSNNEFQYRYAKIDNIIIKDEYREAKGMVNPKKTSANTRTVTKEYKSSDILDTSIYKNELLKKLSLEKEELNDYDKCQGHLHNSTGNQCPKRPTYGNKYCYNHRYYLIYDSAKEPENEDKRLCDKFLAGGGYKSCKVFVLKKSFRRRCEGCLNYKAYSTLSSSSTSIQKETEEIKKQMRKENNRKYVQAHRDNLSQKEKDEINRRRREQYRNKNPKDPNEKITRKRVKPFWEIYNKDIFMNYQSSSSNIEKIKQDVLDIVEKDPYIGKTKLTDMVSSFDNKKLGRRRLDPLLNAAKIPK